MHDGWTAGGVSKVGSRPPTRFALTGQWFAVSVELCFMCRLVD